MTTETTPDPIIAAWSDRLEEDLAEAGMEQPQARAYRLAFELGLTRVISQVATKQELRDAIADLRDELRRELELRFAGVDRRFEGVDLRFEGVDRRFDELDKRFRLLTWAIALGFAGVFAILAAILSRL